MAKDIKEKKSGFKPGVYAVFAIIFVAAFLAIATVFAVKTHYTGFSSEKTATSYVDTIVQNADGYNAYKQTLVSKNQKYGNFIINAYMKPYVNDGEDVEQKEFADTAEEAAVKTPLYNTMYEYYKELISTYGWDDYDTVFSKYFEKLAQLRKELYGDEYMDTEFMFGVLEANVSKYGQEVAGADEELAADGETVIQEAIVGTYQERYGEDYTFTATVTATEDIADVEGYKAGYKDRISAIASSGEAKADAAGLDEEGKEAMIEAFSNLDCGDDIGAVQKCTVEVTLADGTSLTSVDIYVVQIGSSWYVDNTNVSTGGLYFAL